MGNIRERVTSNGSLRGKDAMKNTEAVWKATASVFYFLARINANTL